MSADVEMWLCRCKASNDPMRETCHRCGAKREKQPAPWRPMHEAPIDDPEMRWITGQLADGSQVAMHYACDLSGEEQPPFQGWYAAYEDTLRRGFYQVHPLRWRPVE